MTRNQISPNLSQGVGGTEVLNFVKFCNKASRNVERNLIFKNLNKNQPKVTELIQARIRVDAFETLILYLLTLMR